MSQLFRRTWSIAIGDVDVSDLACSFHVHKTLKPEPNTCELVVFNLAAATRQRLTTPQRIGVRIEAGYGGQNSQIYLGEVRSLAAGMVDGPDIRTELTSGDTEKAMQTARIAVPIGAGASQLSVLQSLTNALGVGPGNIADAAAKLQKAGRLIFARDTVIVGNVARVITDLCRAGNLEWSIQDGTIQLLDIGAALAVKPYSLSASTGLVGSPKLDKDGKVSASVLMLPGLRPGMPVVFDSKFVKGTFRVIEATYAGDTWGDGDDAWGIDIVCDRPGAQD